MLYICCIYIINVIKIFIDKILNIHEFILYTYILCNYIYICTIIDVYIIHIHNILNVIYIASTIYYSVYMCYYTSTYMTFYVIQ
jgi:hypothetical protein